MGKHIIYVFTRKKNSKFLPAIAEGSPSARNLLYVGSHQPQHLISRVMSIGIIEFFEKINADPLAHPKKPSNTNPE
ncbi:hypothetical protein D3C75_664450 [compost metagenome]